MNFTITKSILVLSILCVLSSYVSGRVAHNENYLAADNKEDMQRNSQNYMEMESEESKGNLFKYILNAYHRVTAENIRLREEASQLSAVVSFLTEDKGEADGKSESNKRAMKNIALGFGKK